MTVTTPDPPVLAIQPLSVPALDEVVPEPLADALPKTKKRRPTGKIFALPQEQKDLINQMLDDGKTYRAIEEEMAKLGVELNGENLSNWFTGPYQDYVRNRDWREDLLTLAQSASAIDNLPFGQRFQESLIQLAFVDIFRALKDPETRTDRPNHIRLLNSLARLNREALCARKYNDVRADKAIAEIKPARGTPTDEEIRDGFLLGFERVTGIKPADGPIGPDLNAFLGLDAPSASVSESSSASLAAPKSEEGGSSPSASESSSSSSSASASIPPKSAFQSSSSDFLAAPNSAGGPASPEQCNSDVEGQSAGTPVAVDQSKFESQTDSRPPFGSVQKSKISDECHYCRQELPPLLPNGERPHTHCTKCGTATRHPATLHLYCPHCRGPLHQIFKENVRTSDQCLFCAGILPPQTMLAAPKPDEGGPATPTSNEGGSPAEAPSSVSPPDESPPLANAA